MGRAASLAVICLACLAVGGGRSSTSAGLADIDVSSAAGAQAEVRIAADARRPSHLLAASNSDGDPGMRVYRSQDGGATWSSDVLPSPPGSVSAPCHADPAPAFDAAGNEYVAFIQAAQSCEEGGEHVTIRLAVRDAGSSAWHYWSPSVFAEDPRGSFDDNPWLAADTEPASPYRGRLYLAWFRSVAGSRLGFELSHSDDRGAHWSEPRLVSDRVVDAGYPSLSVGTDGTLYAAWHDFGRGALFLDRSTDGGETFAADVRRPVRERDAPQCPNGRPVPAQRLRCIRSDPTVVADTARNRVYLSYSDRARNGSEDVYVAAYDASLRPAGAPQRLGARERHASGQFWPAAALERVSGRLVVCFYSSGTGTRRRVVTFSCSVSGARGHSWSRARAVARVPSDETRAGADDFAYGDYEGLAVAGGIAHPMWTDSRDLPLRGEEIYTASVPVAAVSPGPRRQVDVSRARGPQNEAAIAVDPSDPSVLVASSNSAVAPMSAYTSTDGGASWSRQAVPSDRPDGRCLGDPALAIDSRGREYFAFLRDAPCGPAAAATGLFVATRAGPAGRWEVPEQPVGGPLEQGESNDKPALATYRGRVYAAWARAVGSDVHAIVVSHSDDGGRSWSAPGRVDAGTVDSGYPSIATGPGGEVYVAWHPFEEDRLLIAGSYDGATTFGKARLVDVKRNRSSCPASWPIPAQARRCVRPNPIVSVDRSGGPFRGRVYVTYGNQAGDGTQDVYVAAFDRSLAPLVGAPVGRRAVIGSRRHRLSHRADQFWPASAVDQATGTLWACFYDTAGDRSRRRAWFSCTSSRTGGATWARIRRVATVASNETQAWASPLQYGDYEGLAASAGTAHPAWTDTRRGRSALREEIFTTATR